MTQAHALPFWAHLPLTPTFPADDVAAGVVPLVAALRRQLERHLASAVSGELVRCGAAVFCLR